MIPQRTTESFLQTSLEIYCYGFKSIATISFEKPARLEARLNDLCNRIRQSTDEEFSRIAGMFLYRIALTLSWKVKAQ